MINEGKTCICRCQGDQRTTGPEGPCPCLYIMFLLMPKENIQYIMTSVALLTKQNGHVVKQYVRNPNMLFSVLVVSFE